MKIAVLSDIHGNDVALEAVLADARAHFVQKLFVLGDVVGYYYQPDRVMSFLSEWPCEMIQGNHEEMLLLAASDKVFAAEVRKRYGGGIDAALKTLDAATVRKLGGLPPRKTVVEDGLSMELCHGSPWDRDVYVYPDADGETLRRCAVPGAGMVFMGHTHHAFVKGVTQTTLVNAGSVGQNRFEGGIATWAFVDTAVRSAEIRRVPYAAARVADEARRRDPGLPYLWEVLFREPKK